jgi:hypothetical protein
MKDHKQLLISFVEIVTFLTAAFGGFLKAVAPPIGVTSSYSIGILSFLILIVLMIVSAVSRRRVSAASSQIGWLTAGVLFFIIAILASVLYPRLLDAFTYPQGSKLSERQIISSDAFLTEDAKQYRSAHPHSSPGELIQNLPDDDIWTSPGIERAESELLAVYACLVLSLSTSIFCLLEANIRRDSP